MPTLVPCPPRCISASPKSHQASDLSESRSQETLLGDGEARQRSGLGRRRRNSRNRTFFGDGKTAWIGQERPACTFANSVLFRSLSRQRIRAATTADNDPKAPRCLLQTALEADYGGRVKYRNRLRAGTTRITRTAPQLLGQRLPVCSVAIYRTHLCGHKRKSDPHQPKSPESQYWN